jgi:hypothetical protein
VYKKNKKKLLNGKISGLQATTAKACTKTRKKMQNWDFFTSNKKERMVRSLLSSGH